MREFLKADFAEAHNALGNALVQLGKLDAAVTSYRRALALRPDIAKVHNNLGRTLGKQGRLEEAEAACRRAIAIAPNYAEAHASLGKILWDSNRIKECCQSFRRSAELSYGAPACNVPESVITAPAIYFISRTVANWLSRHSIPETLMARSLSDGGETRQKSS
jgi:tetratricopeptide (TPR) repeat protein